MNSLLKKLKHNSTIKESSNLAESKFFENRGMVPTKTPMLNVALSGSVDGGVSSGLLTIAGPSKHFKTSFALEIASAYLEQKEDAVLLFYDSEFGAPGDYFNSFGIDMERVFHTPIANVEELKFDLTKQLESLDETDNVIVVIDSVGNLASKKEVEDALAEKSVADMSRAKSIKSLFRVVTPYLKLRDIPLLVINHTYKEMCLAGDTIIKTERGNIPIKDITTEDKVYALNGLKQVLNTFGPDDLASKI